MLTARQLITIGSAFSTADYGFTFFLCSKITRSGFQYGVNAKLIRRVIVVANSWGFGFDVGLQFEKNNGLMVRDITTTYNIWNIDEKKQKKIADAVPGKTRNCRKAPKSPLPKPKLGLSKNLSSVMTTAFGRSINMRFTKTNDLISTDFVECRSRPGSNLAVLIWFCPCRRGNFQNIQQLDSTEKFST
jgi:hypothetical protein